MLQGRHIQIQKNSLTEKYITLLRRWLKCHLKCHLECNIFSSQIYFANPGERAISSKLLFWLLLVPRHGCRQQFWNSKFNPLSRVSYFLVHHCVPSSSKNGSFLAKTCPSSNLKNQSFFLPIVLLTKNIMKTKKIHIKLSYKTTLYERTKLI